jgi:acetolactate synthase-1/2/3 large subunit
VADANMDRAPLVVITGQADSERMHKESHQAMDVVSMMRPVTQWAQTILHPDNTPEVIRKAFKIATTEKTGACHIELPEDIAALEATTVPIAPERLRRPVPDDKIVDRAFDVLKAARRPVILAGNGTIRRRASEQLRRFARRSGIGVISTFMAKGCVDMDDPSCLFTIGLQSKDLVACAIDAADVVLTIGYDMVEYHPNLWNPQGDKRIVHLDFVPAEVDEDYRIEVEVVGDIAHALWMLNERLEAHPELRFDGSQQQAVRRDMIADFETHKDDDTRGSIRPQKAVWDARQVLGAGDVLLSDVGAHKLWVARYYHCHEPNTCLIPNGFCSMGFALPGAIGAAQVLPDRRVLAICGDAGFLMNVQEMETAVRLGVDLVVMVWEDHAYGLIEWKQQTHFGRHSDLGFGNPDFVMLAKAFGWHGRRVENSRDLAPALEAAFAEKGPSLIVIPIDYRENALLTERLGNIACSI